MNDDQNQIQRSLLNLSDADTDQPRSSEVSSSAISTKQEAPITYAGANNSEPEQPKQIRLTKFFEYLSTGDKLLLVFGTLASVLAGGILPSISLVMGNVAAAFSGNSDTTPADNTDSTILQTMTVIAAIVSMIALSLFIFAYMFYAFWQHLAANITKGLRKRYIAALMHQEIAYFEVNKVEQIPAQIAEIFETVQNSIGDKISTFIFSISACVSGIVYAMVYGWAYALACVAYLPFLLTILIVFGLQVKKSSMDKLDAVKQLGGIAEETLTAIKVVTGFGREQRELQKFTEFSVKTQEVAQKQSETYALMVGLMKFTIFFFYSYALYVGSWFIQNKVPNPTAADPNQIYDFKTVIQTVIALITGFVCLISALPNVQAIVAAQTLGALIFEVIERDPLVKNGPNPSRNIKLDQAINFKNVTFKYPTSLPEHKPVLIDASFSLQAGKATAIVGPSGSGKSTIVQLVERFYDPRSGSVDFDGFDIKNLDLKVLRENIGYVSQEPIMIMGTIRDNLLYGNKDATEEQCIQALKDANAGFVQDQEHGMDTFVGTAGIMNMSGGQKQRIAIARALIKRPKILILDEATSALDPKSELEVQGAIEKIAQSGSGLTIIIIAHRLTTIESADNLLFFKSRSELVTAQKGTEEYNEIFERLKSISYAQGQDDEHNDSDEDANEDEEGLAKFGTPQDVIVEDNEEHDHDEFGKSVIEQKQNDLQFTSGSLNAEPEVDEYFIGEAKKTSSYKKTPPNFSGKGDTELEKSLLAEDRLPPSRTATTPRSGSSNLSKKMAVTTPRRGSQQRTSSILSSGSTISEREEAAAMFKAQQAEPEYREVAFGEIMRFYKPQWLAVAGFSASVVASLSLPMFGFVLSKYIFVLSEYHTVGNSDATVAALRNEWTGVFVALCFGIGIAAYLQKLWFGRGGENLTFTLRVRLFEAFLHKQIGWFDNKNRAPGILTNIITEDISAVNGLTTESLAIAVEAALGLFFSCMICMIFSWQLGFVVTLTSPFMVLGGLGMSKLQFNQKAVDDSYKQANALLNDLIMNYRTVISFGEKNVDFMLCRYNQLLVVPHQTNIKRAHISGLFFGYSQSIRFVFIGFVFFVAALFVQREQLGQIETQKVFTGCYVVFVGAIGSGVSISQMPSISKAKQAARTVFGIIEEKSQIDPKQQGQKQNLTGCIEFRNLYFRYPSRQQYVLRRFNLRIEPNQSVAIVGHSGSGKSTIASLLLRFYDAVKGSVVIDGINIKDYDLEKYRNQVSIVQQEPMLFNETIKSNIKFGDLSASDARVLEVAIQANALAFIMQNDEDYSAPSVIQKVTENFKTLQQEAKYSQYPKVLSLLQLAQKQTIDYKHLMFINMMLPFMQAEGLQFLEANFDDVIAAIKQQSVKADCTWQKVVKAIDYQKEALQIEAYLKESSLSEEQRKDVQTCLLMNECQFDLKTVRGFSEAVKDDSSKQHFSVFLKADRQRVESHYESRFASFVDQETLKALENELDPGFLKICGLKGSKLSGGQKQRIAIARALIKAPKIMILDEATSALDEQSQEIVQQALDRAMEGRTSVVIAHRMSTIKKCNRIVVVHKGKVVEDGTYEELTQIKDGHFARLEAGIA